MSGNKKTVRRLVISVIAVVLLFIGLCLTTFALVWTSVSVENNFFQTGSVKINLNDGKPVIEEHEFLFEPGMRVEKTFFLENRSTWEVYYKVYFTNVDGGLADVLEITISDGEEILFHGTAAELTRKNVSAAKEPLLVNERRDLKILFCFPREAGNTAQDLTLAFDLCAEAVQTRNNPDKLFD